MVDLPLLGKRAIGRCFRENIPFDGNFQSLIDNGTIIWKEFPEYERAINAYKFDQIEVYTNDDYDIFLWIIQEY